MGSRVLCHCASVLVLKCCPGDCQLSASSAGRVCWLIQCVSPCFRVVRRSENGCFLHSVALFQLARGPHMLERPWGCRCLGFSRCLRSTETICSIACCVRLRKGSGLLVKSFASARCRKLLVCPFACETCPCCFSFTGATCLLCALSREVCVLGVVLR